MENNCSIVAVLVILFFLSSSSIWSGQQVQGQIANLEKGFKLSKGIVETAAVHFAHGAHSAHAAYDTILENFGEPHNTDEPKRPAGVYSGVQSKLTRLQVDNQQQLILQELIPQQPEFTAFVSISQVVSWFDNYSPTSSCTNCQCCQECQCVPTDSPEQCRGTTLATDTFKINDVSLPVTYGRSNCGSGGQTTVVLSFSRSNFSLINHLEQQIFSYRITDSTSYFKLGFVPDGKFQSTKLVTGPFPDYKHLYYVQLRNITIGDNVIMLPTPTPVIIDTIILPILLEVALYNNVKENIMESMKTETLENTNNQLLCYYSNNYGWPDLKLFFPSSSAADALMVLTKENYVISDPDTNTECAAILPTQGLSVIGSMAQLNRDMIFNVQQSTLHFSDDQYSGSSASGETEQIGSPSTALSEGYAIETKASHFIEFGCSLFIFMFLG